MSHTSRGTFWHNAFPSNLCIVVRHAGTMRMNIMWAFLMDANQADFDASWCAASLDLHSVDIDMVQKGKKRCLFSVLLSDI